VELRVGDGYQGWPEAAPFDVILVTAAPERVPKPLLEQLAVGGRLVIPVGPTEGVQELERWSRKTEGQGEAAFERERLMSVRFVPFLGDGVKQ
jgi:protein-L-isoaspartate(D-aspartate) O-methyltransferase